MSKNAKVTAPSKIHGSKDASNAVLKKLGVDKVDYPMFQEKREGGKYETFHEEAQAHVEKLAREAEEATRVQATKPVKASKSKPKTPKAIKEPKAITEKGPSAASVMKQGLIDGLTKAQILESLNQTFPEVWTEEKCKKDAWHISWHKMDAIRKNILPANYVMAK
jgi:hypothetical protein